MFLVLESFALHGVCGNVGEIVKIEDKKIQEILLSSKIISKDIPKESSSKELKEENKNLLAENETLKNKINELEEEIKSLNEKISSFDLNKENEATPENGENSNVSDDDNSTPETEQTDDKKTIENSESTNK